MRLRQAQYGKPHAKTNKSDYIDAEATAKAHVIRAEPRQAPMEFPTSHKPKF